MTVGMAGEAAAEADGAASGLATNGQRQTAFKEERRRSLLPSRAATLTYASFAKPLVVTLIGKIATYSSLAHVATTVSVAGTAAHRVLMCVYCTLANRGS